MKIFRLFLVISVAIAICYLSWNIYTGRSLQKKHERAKLVLADQRGVTNISDLERFYE